MLTTAFTFVTSVARHARLAFALALALGLVTLSSPADAYCRSTTCRSGATTADEACQSLEGGVMCDSGAAFVLPLWWGTGCVGYSLDAAASARVDYADALAAAQGAFAAWTDHACGGRPVDIDARDLAATTGGAVEYRLSGPNTNTIVFRDDAWPHAGASGARSGELALTTVTFAAATGQILDADIEINTAEYDIRPGDASALGEGAYDLQAVLTHEAGHFLGLGHSADREALMFPRTGTADVARRTLGADDGQALCAAYPPRDGSATARASLGAAGRVGGACRPRATPGATTPTSTTASGAQGPTDPRRLACAAGPIGAPDAPDATDARVRLAAAGLGALALAAARRRRAHRAARTPGRSS
jgi:hypothetical protein